jgi:hypothetical protein
VEDFEEGRGRMGAMEIEDGMERERWVEKAREGRWKKDGEEKWREGWRGKGLPALSVDTLWLKDRRPFSRRLEPDAGVVDGVAGGSPRRDDAGVRSSAAAIAGDRRGGGDGVRGDRAGSARRRPGRRPAAAAHPSGSAAAGSVMGGVFSRESE